MSLGDNIHNAFEVVIETYDNINKLMSFCQKEALDKGEFVLSSPKFLRYKSDNEINGWLTKSFVLLFQKSKDKPLENQWRRGPVYVMEINLHPDIHKVPMVSIAKFVYKKISSWEKGVSISAHWAFFDPLYNTDVTEFEGDDFSYSGTINDEYSDKYRGLQRLVGIGVPLADITWENAYETIFGGFRSLIVK